MRACRPGNTHGTGCTLASAIAAELAKGRDMPSAVKRAKRYLWRVVERSVGLPIGKGVQVGGYHDCFERYPLSSFTGVMYLGVSGVLQREGYPWKVGRWRGT